MSHQRLREDQTCLNCGAHVEDRFCPHCGQENVVNRPSFHYLFTTFLHDLVSYDSGLWKTMKRLFSAPGKLIKEFLAGKRQRFVPPIKLYFFVSLITFLLPTLLATQDRKEDEKEETKEVKSMESHRAIYPQPEAGEPENIAITFIDSIPNALPDSKKLDSLERLYFEKAKKIPYKIDSLSKKLDPTKKKIKEQSENSGSLWGLGNQHYYQSAKTVREFDSIDKKLVSRQRLGWMVKPIYRKSVELQERGIVTGDQFEEEFSASFQGNFSRVLIFYMPIFAFILWIFHRRKRWKYYDHGIFTLYYFSLLLILTFFVMVMKWLIFLPVSHFPKFLWPARGIGLVFGLTAFLYGLWYFFKAHRCIYDESKTKSFTKGLVIFFLNCFLFVGALLIYTLMTFLNI